MFISTEDRHNLGIAGLELSQKVPFGTRVLAALFGPTRNQLHFPVSAPHGGRMRHRIGLPAGFDKNCLVLPALQALGFAFLVGGTITPRPQPGNEKPRVWRFPQDLALVNAMGFPNQGARRVARNLEKTRHKITIPLGLSAGKQKETPLDEADSDYILVIETLDEYADFWEVNVSSPNTVGLRDLQRKDYLKRLTSGVRTKTQKRVMVKVSPDLQPHELIEMIEVCQEEGIDGLCIGNTTSGRYGTARATDLPGGWSGPQLFEKSFPLVALARQQAPNLYIIGAGGISSGAKVLQMVQAGADSVAVYTSFVYRGPSIVRSLLSEMA